MVSSCILAESMATFNQSGDASLTREGWILKTAVLIKRKTAVRRLAEDIIENEQWGCRGWHPYLIGTGRRF